MILESFDPFLADFGQFAQRALGRSEHASPLPMDISRRGEEILLRLDVPGVPADAIDVSVEDRTLTVTASRRASWAEEEQVLVQERFEGTASRRLRLPDDVDASRVSAEWADGVLVLRLPIAEAARPRKVQVSTGTGAAAQQLGA